MIQSLNANAPLAKVVAEKQGDPSFPERGVDYYDRFTHVDDYLNKKVHPNVNTGPTAREPLWLTDHGPDHIATVIRRAGDLVIKNEPILSPYECYILLLACHFHDVGNIFGREEHEKKVHEVMFSPEATLVGEDTLEKRLICDIAMAHGGYVNTTTKDKDTIGKLRYDRTTKTNGIDVKKLAAILRLADELADDKTRTNRFVQEATRQIHPGSEMFHAYAAHLRPTEVKHDSRSIDIHFELNVDAIMRKYQKLSESKFLFEEILVRTLKMHREHIYCSRFMLPDVLIERINVQIDVCTSNYSKVLGHIKYTMAQSGYPEHPTVLSDICPELIGITGDSVAKQVELLNSSDSSTHYAAPVDLIADSQRKSSNE